MSNPVWPPGLPQYPDKSGYQETGGGLVVEVETDSGVMMSRRRYKAVPEQLQLRFMLTSSELDTFLAFYRVTIDYGAQVYDWTHPRTGAAITCRMRPRPQWSPVGGRWYVTFSVAIQP